MGRFLIVVHGEYPPELERGFYTGRFIKAESLEEAEQIAIERVTADKQTYLREGDSPILSVVSRQKVGFFRWLRKSADGSYVYYDEGAPALE